MVARDAHCLTFDQDIPDDVVMHVSLYEVGGDRLMTQEEQGFATLSLDEW